MYLLVISSDGHGNARQAPHGSPEPAKIVEARLDSAGCDTSALVRSHEVAITRWHASGQLGLLDPTIESILGIRTRDKQGRRNLQDPGGDATPGQRPLVLESNPINQHGSTLPTYQIRPNVVPSLNL